MAMTEAEKEYFVRYTLAHDALWKLFHNPDHQKARKILLKLVTPNSPPDPKRKGLAGANCNRTACQLPGAVFKHRHSGSYYCYSCAHDINFANLDLAVKGGHEIDLITLDLGVLTTLDESN